MTATARRTGGSEKQQLSVLKTMTIPGNLKAGANPPEIARFVRHAVRQEISSADPYKEVKTESTRRTLALLPDIRRFTDNSKDPLSTAIRLAIAGNTGGTVFRPVY
jgi:uncharacterized protein with ATP-grasp and redox domains